MDLEEYLAVIETLRKMRSRKHKVSDESLLIDRLSFLFSRLSETERRRLIARDLDPGSLHLWRSGEEWCEAGEFLPPDTRELADLIRRFPQ